MLRRSHVSSHGSADRDRRAIGVAARARTDSVFQSHDERARLLKGALAWLTAHLDFFDPPQEDAILDVTPEHVQPGARRKAFGELGLALQLASRAPALRARPDIRRLNDAWLGMARDRRIFFDVRRRVHLVPLLAVALTVCDALDSAPGDAVAALQTVLDRNFLDRTERSAWSQADIA